MRSFQLSYLVSPLLLILLPAALHGRLLHPTPWLASVLILVVLVTQPAPDKREMTDRSAADRHSAMWIYAGVAVPVLVGSLDFSWIATPPVAPTSAWVVGGAALAIASLAFRVWAIRTLGRFFTATVQVQGGQRVIDTGPYRRVRHPSYTGAIGWAFGSALLFGSPLAVLLVVVLTLPAYAYRMGVEERTLAAELGPEYVAYMGRTKRLVPFVY